MVAGGAVAHVLGTVGGVPSRYGVSASSAQTAEHQVTSLTKQQLLEQHTIIQYTIQHPDLVESAHFNSQKFQFRVLLFI